MRLNRLIPALLVLGGVAAASALAAGPSAGGATTQSIFSPDGKLMYATKFGRHRRTVVSLWRNGRITRTVRLHGGYGVPVISIDGSTGGVSADGRTLVLASWSPRNTRFAVLDGHTLRLRRVARLRGQFSFDALSPTGKTLYLIQHVDSRFSNRYYVRAYDLARGHLLKKIIFDTREKWGLMSGVAVTRVTGPTGRWAYTLYSRPGGRPFVHALDTSARKAVCIDLPWHGSQNPIMRMRLKLKPGKLMVGRYAVIDTRTFRVRT
jgi:hypothetical protein